MRDPRDGTLVVVEVRQRASATHGGAAGSITGVKRRREEAAHRARRAALSVPAAPAAALPLRCVVPVEERIAWTPAAFDAD